MVDRCDDFKRCFLFGDGNFVLEFCERGKLFRYSQENKEWKERGIGEMKILYHPVDKSYRLLMRREQVSGELRMILNLDGRNGRF